MSYYFLLMCLMNLQVKWHNSLVVCLSYSILYLCCKVHSNTPNDCRDFANLLLEYFNLDHPLLCTEPLVTIYADIIHRSEDWWLLLLMQLLRNGRGRTNVAAVAGPAEKTELFRRQRDDADIQMNVHVIMFPNVVLSLYTAVSTVTTATRWT